MSWLAAWALLKRGLSTIGDTLGRLKGWQILCIGLALFGAIQTVRVWAEQRHAHKVETQLIEANRQLQLIRDNSKKAEGAGKQISHEIRGKTDGENRRIAGDANSLRVSGPGKSLCRPAPAAPGGHEQGPTKPDAAGPALPTADFAAVPWGWLTDRGEEHDQLLAEDKAWREWYDRLVAAWPK